MGWGRAARRGSPAPSHVAPTAGGARPGPARGGGVPAVELERGGWGSPGGLLRSGLCPSTRAGACRKLFPCEFGRRISPSWAVSKTSRQGSILGLIPRLSCPSAPVQTPVCTSPALSPGCCWLSSMIAPQLWRQPGLGGAARRALLLETAPCPCFTDEKLGDGGEAFGEVGPAQGPMVQLGSLPPLTRGFCDKLMAISPFTHTPCHGRSLRIHLPELRAGGSEGQRSGSGTTATTPTSWLGFVGGRSLSHFVSRHSEIYCLGCL